jgi:hypothetical protein
MVAHSFHDDPVARNRILLGNYNLMTTVQNDYIRHGSGESRQRRQFSQSRTFSFPIDELTFSVGGLSSATPPPQHLTQTQIADGTKTFVYHDNTFFTDYPDIEAKCPITYADFRENDICCQINHCKHTFLKDPLMQWFTNNSTCPVCRHNLSPTTATATTATQPTITDLMSIMLSSDGSDVSTSLSGFLTDPNTVSTANSLLNTFLQRHSSN